ncbi:MAG: protein kinase [Planctomycetota bacterium]
MVGTFGRFELREALGQGGAGTVYRAFDPRAGREVALKLLLHDSPRARARFARELEACRRLRHPGIAGVLDGGEEGGKPYLVMELVSGRTLERLLSAERELSPTRAAELVRDVARAIQYAHEQGVLHRDLKPSNLILDREGRVRLVDFGLALLEADDSARLSRSGQMLGTPAFMSPEQARGRTVGPATDVWGLGAVLFGLLTGEGPFERSQNPLVELTESTAPPPSSLRPGVPPALDAVCARALAREPAERYPSAEALARDLEAYLDGASPSPARDRRAPGAGVALAGVALAGALGAGALGTLALLPRGGGQATGAPSTATSSSPSNGAGAAAGSSAAFRAALAADAGLEELQRLLPPGDAQAGRALEVLRRLEEARALARAEAPSTDVLALAEGACSLVGDDPQLGPRAAIEAARLAFARGHAERAAPLLEPWLRAPGPRGAELRTLAGIALVRDSGPRRAEGLRLLTAVVDEDPRGAWGRVARVQQLLVGVSKGPTLLDAARRALEDAPGRVEARRLLLEALARLGLVKEVEEQLPALRADSPCGPDVACLGFEGDVLLVAATKLPRSERDGAAETINRLAERLERLERPQESAKALELRAGVAQLLHRPVEALELYRRCYRLQPEGTWVVLWTTCLRQGLHQEAVSLAREVQRRLPESLQRGALALGQEEPLLGLRLLRMAGRPPVAEGELSRFVRTSVDERLKRLSPPAAAALRETLLLCARGATWELLAPGFAAARAAAPMDRACLLLEAEVRIERRLPEEALRCLDALATLGGSGDEELALRGEALYRLGRLAECQRLVASTQGRQDAMGYAAQAFVAFALRDYQTVLAQTERVLAEQPGHRLGRWLRAMALVASGQLEPARAMTREIALREAFLDLNHQQLLAEMLMRTAAVTGNRRALHDGLCRAEACLAAAPRNPSLALACASTSMLVHFERYRWDAAEWIELAAEMGAPKADTERERGLWILRAGGPREEVLGCWRTGLATLPSPYRKVFRERFGADPQ